MDETPEVCPHCGGKVRYGRCRDCDWPEIRTVTVTFEPHDAISIIRALREVVTPEVLRIVAQAELSR